MKKLLLLMSLVLILSSCAKQVDTRKLANNVGDAATSFSYEATQPSDLSYTSEIYTEYQGYNPNIAEPEYLFENVIYAKDNNEEAPSTKAETTKAVTKQKSQSAVQTTVQTTAHTQAVAQTTKQATAQTKKQKTTTAKKVDKTKSSKKKKSTVAKYTTWYNTKNEARSTNIELAAKKLDGHIVKPGEIFSFNKTLGKSSSRDGFKVAKIVIDGKEALGMGGGICQVSTTLFNASYAAGMETIERHAHTKEVEYVPKNKDATVAYGGKDFKFKNTSKVAQKITAVAKKGELTISIVPV